MRYHAIRYDTQVESRPTMECYTQVNTQVYIQSKQKTYP